jgi:ubiquinone biosynthesis protein
MALSLRPQHAAQYTKIARLLLKHGRRDLVERAGGDAAVDIRDEGPGIDPDEERTEAEALASELERMGPTFIKLGQLLSTRADLLPQAYLKALGRLQDKVEPIPFEEVRRIVEDELGARVSKAFDHFDETPLAAASLGQVHRARLRSGREVAVKVQRPNIRTRIIDDLDALVELAGVVDKKTDVGRRYGFEAMVEEFRRSSTTAARRRTSAASAQRSTSSSASSCRSPSTTTRPTAS